MLRRNRMAKKYNTERYVRIFWHIYYKWSILIIQYKINIKFTFTVHECLIVYEYIWIYSIIQFEIYIYIYIYILYIYYIYTIILYIYIYMYICIYYIYIYELCAFRLLQHCRNSYVRWLHWFHIHMIFSSWFY